MGAHRRNKWSVIRRSLINSLPKPIEKREFEIRHITFELTNLCNSKCDMCHIWANQDEPGVLTTNDIRKAFADPAFAAVEDIILTGGELFLRDDVNEIIDILRMHNPDIVLTLSTNGMLNEKIIDSAEHAFSTGAHVSFGVSLDGIGLDHDKRRRVPGNFDIIDKIVLPALIEISRRPGSTVSVAVGHCLDQYGLGTIQAVKDYSANLGVGFMTQLIEDFDYYLPSKKRETSVESQVSAIDARKSGFTGENRITKKNYGDIANKKYQEVFNLLPPNTHHHRVVSVLEGRSARYQCSSMRSFILLRYNGDVAPCLRFADIVFGNIREQSMTEILKKQEYLGGADRVMHCDGCLNTWCTDWSMEDNAFPFWRQILSSYGSKLKKKILG